MFQAFLKEFYSLFVEGRIITIIGLSLSTLGYQLLALATSQLVDDNREFGVSCIFSPI